MAPPSALAIATSSLNRLIKEEASYHKELEGQQKRINKLEAGESQDEENAEYILKQERKAYKETELVFPELRRKITDALANLEKQIENNESDAPSEEITKAKEAKASATKVLQEETK